MALTPGTFMTQSRNYGGKMTGHIGLRCRVCRREEWKPGANPGWGPRMFPQWLLGRNGAGTDVCPGCRNQKEKRPDMSPAMKRAAYNRIEDKLAGTSLSTPMAVVHDRLPPDPPANTVMADKLKEAMEKVVEAEKTKPVPWPVTPGAIWPARLQSAGVDKRSTLSCVGFSRRGAAVLTAAKYIERSNRPDAKPVFALDMTGAWMWWIEGFEPPAKVGLADTSAGRAVHSFRERLRLAGKNPPSARALADKPATVVVIRKEDPVVTTEEAQARQPTREQRRSILDQLDAAYDSDGQRYRADGSDQKLADKLNVPRAWVAQLRGDLYGDHDRNEAAEKQAAQLDEAIALAQNAVTQLVEMAAQAEKLMSDLKAAKARVLR